MADIPFDKLEMDWTNSDARSLVVDLVVDGDIKGYWLLRRLSDGSLVAQYGDWQDDERDGSGLYVYRAVSEDDANALWVWASMQARPERR